MSVKLPKTPAVPEVPLRRAQTVPRSELETLGNEWHISGSVPFYVLSRDPQGAVYFKREDLDAFDLRLAPLVELLLPMHTAEYAGNVLSATLRLWRNAPTIAAPSLWSVSRYFDQVTRVVDCNMQERTVCLEGDTAIVSVIGGITCAAQYETNQKLSLTFETLEEQYPGSIGRLQVGIALAMRAESLVTLIITDEAPPAIALPEGLCPT